SGLWPLLAARGASVSFVLIFVLISRRGLPLNRASIIPALAAGILDMAANITYLLAVRGSLLIVTTIIVSLYPAPTVLLARFVLKERLSLLKIAGLLCAVAGVALMGL
ncbi:MAG: EamA/RhaT family transporter, partial [Spirochaetales bacterium]